MGVPARPRAAAVQVPERPRAAGRGRRGHGPAALSASPARTDMTFEINCATLLPQPSLRYGSGDSPQTGLAATCLAGACLVGSAADEARDATRLRRPDRVGRHGARGRPARLPLRVDLRGLGRRRGHCRLLDRRDDGADRDRDGDHADAGAHARDHGDDRRDARSALGRPRPARPRHLRPAGGRGLARRPWGKPLGAHAGVRRDRARSLRRETIEHTAPTTTSRTPARTRLASASR